MNATSRRIDTWEALLHDRSGIHLTALAPLEPGDSATNRVRLVDLRREAERSLVGGGAAVLERPSLLEVFDEVLDSSEVLGGPFHGVALFSASEFSGHLGLPFSPAMEARVGARFRLRSILPLVGALPRFYVLALSLHQVRVLEVDPFGFHVMPLPGVPTRFDEAGGYEYETERQVYSASNATLGRRTGVAHSEGGTADDGQKTDVHHYFDRLARKLMPMLADRHAPIVLATVESHAAAFRLAAKDSRILPSLLHGSPDHLNGETLVAGARPIVEAWCHERFVLELASAGEARKIRTDLREILGAAAAGRVAKLWIARGASQWGEWDGVLGRFETHEPQRPGDEDLLDRALFETLRHRGEAHELAPELLPEKAPAAAIVRY